MEPAGESHLICTPVGANQQFPNREPKPPDGSAFGGWWTVDVQYTVSYYTTFPPLNRECLNDARRYS